MAKKRKLDPIAMKHLLVIIKDLDIAISAREGLEVIKKQSLSVEVDTEFFKGTVEVDPSDDLLTYHQKNNENNLSDSQNKKFNMIWVGLWKNFLDNYDRYMELSRYNIPEASFEYLKNKGIKVEAKHGLLILKIMRNMIHHKLEKGSRSFDRNKEKLGILKKMYLRKLL